MNYLNKQEITTVGVTSESAVCVESCYQLFGAKVKISIIVEERIKIQRRHCKQLECPQPHIFKQATDATKSNWVREKVRVWIIITVHESLINI